MFEQENFSTPRMHTAYHLEVVAMDYCFGIIKHRLMPKLGCPISVRLRGGLGSLHSPNDDSNYTYSQLVVTYTFPSHSQGISEKFEQPRDDNLSAKIGRYGTYREEEKNVSKFRIRSVNLNHFLHLNHFNLF